MSGMAGRNARDERSVSERMGGNEKTRGKGRLDLERSCKYITGCP